MKWKLFFKMLSLILLTVLFTQCTKGPGAGLIPEPDEDSDRPEWAGGDTDSNTHIRGNDESGTTRGGDYGDLYVLKRDINGVPIMTAMNVDEDPELEYFVQPIDAQGNDIILDQYGEIPEGSPVIEVDFGRLNIVRSPQSVLDQALDEALKVINAGDGFTLDFCGRLTIWNYDLNDSLIITKTIDSPRENMAMYQELMNNRFTNRLGALIGSGIDPITLAASCFAAGSDKTGTVDIDEVVYINGFLNCLGCAAIPNPHEFEFNSTTPKQYFNFANCECEGQPFRYTRNIYKDRELIFYNYVNGEYTEWKRESVWDAMEDVGGFSTMWEQGDTGYETHVKGFAIAVDDAVQVLDFVHGNSNVEFAAIPPE